MLPLIVGQIEQSEAVDEASEDEVGSSEDQEAAVIANADAPPADYVEGEVTKTEDETAKGT